MADEIVEVGAEGWLFLSGGSNPFLTYLRGADTLPQDVLTGWRQLLLSRHEKMRSLGIRYLHAFAPDKSTIYADKLLVGANTECSHIARLAEVAGDLFLDLRPYFAKQKNSFDLYHKTDSHWNFYGAFSALQMMLAVLGYKVDDAVLRKRPIVGNIVWDLGAKMQPPLAEVCEIRDILEKGQRVWANDLVKAKERLDKPNEGRLHVGSVVIFKNAEAVNQGRVVIFGDSFSEYRPHLLTAMFAECFSEVHFVWSTSISFEYISLVKPELVISEIAERFARLVPKDDISIQAVVERQLAEYFGRIEGSEISALPTVDDLSKIRSA